MGHLTKTHGGKKGQIRPMIRFCFFLEGRVTTGRANFSIQFIFPRTPFCKPGGWMLWISPSAKSTIVLRTKRQKPRGS